MTFKNVIKPILICFVALGLASCESVYDSRDNCVNGIKLKFRFDYHMEPGANAFAANVDCVEVYVFDSEGNYLTQFSETSEQLRRDDYRMILPLAEGDYRLLVYGGLSCQKNTFEISSPWFEAARNAAEIGSHHENVVVTLPLDNDGISRRKLHDIDTREGGLFYGFQYRPANADAWTHVASTPSRAMEVSVTNEDFGTDYTEYEVNMVKDTNNIQVILQEIASPYTVDYNEYEFTIIDDNFKLDSYNNPIHIADGQFQPIYRPYKEENRIMGYVEQQFREGAQIDEDPERPVQVGCVEFSTSRLCVEHINSARLVVRSTREHNDDGTPREIINIPLITYLTATRGFGSNWIRSDQEYLDRQSNWTLFFFLQTGRWVSATIAVNDWIVRVNDVTLDH